MARGLYKVLSFRDTVEIWVYFPKIVNLLNQTFVLYYYGVLSTLAAYPTRGHGFKVRGLGEILWVQSKPAKSWYQFWRIFKPHESL